MKMSVGQALNAKPADKQDMIIRVMQNGVRGQGSVKASNFWG